MNRIRFTLLLSCLGLSTLLMWAQTPAKRKLIEFDAPGAGQGPNQGTVSAVIAADGAITGWYTASNNMVHGFLRNPDGTFATFDPTGSVATYAEGINQAHVIVGQYSDTKGVKHGFVRLTEGKIVSYNAPGAGNGSNQGTTLAAINIAGEMVGYYVDANSVYHGFLLTRNGIFTQFDAPDAGNGPFQGTFPAISEGITAQGAVGGTYYDVNYTAHGFIRAQDGTFSEFDAISDNAGTFVYGINSKQAVAGVYEDLTGALGGFMRTSDGIITDIPIPLPQNGSVTFGVNSINDDDSVVGFYANSATTPAARAYVRNSGGDLTHFRAPDAGTGDSQGTFPYANNNAGEITGPYIDSSGAYHGFIVE